MIKVTTTEGQCQINFNILYGSAINGIKPRANSGKIIPGQASGNQVYGLGEAN
jgi:hypothetical protein